jgi:hypothetical protein
MHIMMTAWSGRYNLVVVPRCPVGLMIIKKEFMHCSIILTIICIAYRRRILRMVKVHGEEREIKQNGTLFLDHLEIETIDEVEGLQGNELVRHLYLNGNKIKSLSGFQDLPNLESVPDES